MSPEQPPLLPVWAVVRRSYGFAWDSRRLLAIPYLIYALVTTGADLLLNLTQPQQQGADAVLVIVEEVFGLAFAVAIQRYVLLGEAGRGLNFFRWDRYFLQYLVTTFFLVLLGAFVSLFLFGLVASIGASVGLVDPTTGQANDPNLFRFVLALALAPIAVVLARLALALPAAALGEPDRLRLVWQATRSNGFRLFAASLLVLFPFMALEFALLRTAPDGSDVGLPVLVVVGLVSPIQLIVITIMSALSYDVLVRGGGPNRAL